MTFEFFQKTKVITNKIGFARSLMAFSLLLTLVFNDSSILFSEEILNSKNFALDNINLFKVLGYDGILISYLISVIILIFVVSGFYPRYSGILHWWVTFSFFTSSILVEGGEQIATLITLLLIPITIFDKRKNHFLGIQKLSTIQIEITSITITIIAIQIAIVYLEAGIGKVYNAPQWIDGTAMYYWLNNEYLTRDDFLRRIMNWLMQIPYVVVLMTYTIIIFEITLFGLLFSNDKLIKRKMFFIAIIFHFMIFLFFGLPTFFLNMLGVLILYLTNLNTKFKITNFLKSFK